MIHDLRFLRNFFANLRVFFGIINIINDDIISGVLSFQTCNGSMWLRGSDKPIQKLNIFCSVYEF